MENSVPSTRPAPIPAAPLKSRPSPKDVLELLKPITWFPPMWAFMCGAISSGAGLEGRWWFVAGGILLAGPLVCGLTYEGLSWFTGATVMLGAMPAVEVIIVLFMYSLGAHGIMVLNDFKAVEGDRQTGLTSLPVVMGVEHAARFACITMASAQIVVIALLALWGFALSALIVTGVLGAQIAAMPKLIRDPAKYAPWYNGVGVTLYVLGMLAAALGLGGYI